MHWGRRRLTNYSYKNTLEAITEQCQGYRANSFIPSLIVARGIVQNCGNAPLLIYFQYTCPSMLYHLQYSNSVTLFQSSIVNRPLEYLKRILKRTIQSSSFLACFIGFYQTGMCLYSNFVPTWSTKYWVFLNGFISGLSILVEQKSRRVELAIFSFPKALASFYMIMIEKGYAIWVPGTELFFGSLSMGILMSLYQLEPEHISHPFYKLFLYVLGPY